MVGGASEHGGDDSEDLLEPSADEEMAFAWAVMQDRAWDRLGLAVGVGDRDVTVGVAVPQVHRLGVGGHRALGDGDDDLAGGSSLFDQ